MKQLERASKEMPSHYSAISIPVRKSEVKQMNSNELKERSGDKDPIQSNYTVYTHNPSDDIQDVHKTKRFQRFIVGLGVGFLSFQLFLFFIVVCSRLF